MDDFGARWYDAAGTFRWISPDPLTARIYDPLSLNKYSYVRNDPVNLIDPDGRSFIRAIGGFFGKIGRAVGSAVGRVADFYVDSWRNSENQPGFDEPLDADVNDSNGDGGGIFGGPQVIGLPEKPQNLDCLNMVISVLDASITNFIPGVNIKMDLLAAESAILTDFKNGKLTFEAAFYTMWNLSLGLIGGTANTIAGLSTALSGPVGGILALMAGASTTAAELVSLEDQAPKTTTPFRADWSRLSNQSSFAASVGFVFAKSLDGLGATNLAAKIADDCHVSR